MRGEVLFTFLCGKAKVKLGTKKQPDCEEQQRQCNRKDTKTINPVFSNCNKILDCVKSLHSSSADIKEPWHKILRLKREGVRLNKLTQIDTSDTHTETALRK